LQRIVEIAMLYIFGNRLENIAACIENLQHQAFKGGQVLRAWVLFVV
jgi:hypothetical protein